MRLICLFILLFLCTLASAQVSDFITVKKKSRSVKSFFPGSRMAIQTVYGNSFKGVVEEVKNDSIFIRQYDIRSVPNDWGVYSVDTIGSLVAPTHYKDIRVVFFD